MRRFVAGTVLLLASFVAFADNNLHADPIAPVILGVTGILFCAVIGRYLARHVDQPAVVGELLMGIIIGNVGYALGSDLVTLLREVPRIFDVMSGVTTAVMFDAETARNINRVLNGPDGGVLLQVAHTVDVFSRYGVIFLLFLVGLGSSVEEMRTVGGESARVAVIGVVAPFVLGLGAMHVLVPDMSAKSHMFVAATLGATSVGITARVLQELGRTGSREGQVIIGAALMDDVLGLVILAVVSGIVVSGSVEYLSVGRTILLSLAFLGGAIALGPYALRIVIPLLARLDLVEAKLFTSFVFVMVLAWVASLAGLATIVGAFTAGLVLRDSFFEDVFDPVEVVTIKDLIQPLEVILVPIFFVLMGIQVKLEKLYDPQVLILATGLIIAAIVGKVVCGIGAGRGSNRLAVGFGMLPRGEVGLIFASIGKTLGVIGDTLFSSVVIMVIVTTLLAPGLLKWSLQRRSGAPTQA